jgi:hypothetical protein
MQLNILHILWGPVLCLHVRLICLVAWIVQVMEKEGVHLSFNVQHTTHLWQIRTQSIYTNIDKSGTQPNKRLMVTAGCSHMTSLPEWLQSSKSKSNQPAGH